MHTTELFLLAMLIVLTVPYLIWRVGRTDYVAPLVVVQIITGILLGPGVLGAVFPGYFEFVFTSQVVMALNGVAWWAVSLFVFLAGLELDLAQAWQHRRESFVTAGLALATPMALGSVAALWLLPSTGWMGPASQPWQFVVGIGMACAVTALPILILLMEKMAILRHPLGQRILRYASLDDIVIWGVLALIVMDFERLGRQALFLMAYGGLAWGCRALIQRLPDADRWYVALIWLVFCALGADWCGLHFMVGAFLAGAALDAHWFGVDALDRLRNNVLLILMPVFFLSTGLRTQWGVDGVSVFAAAGLLLLASVAGKLVGVMLAGRWLGWPTGQVWVVGWLLQTKALIMIIFANILLDKLLITAQTFTALLLMAVASTMLTTPMVARKLRRLLLTPETAR